MQHKPWEIRYLAESALWSFFFGEILTLSPSHQVKVMQNALKYNEIVESLKQHWRRMLGYVEDNKYININDQHFETLVGPLF
jgi:hypothetical protein